MAKCEDCQQEMLVNRELYPMNNISCDFDMIRINGKTYKRNTVYHDVNKYCHDCGILNGGVHHMGCDMERCPICDGQMIACDCDWSDYQLGSTRLAKKAGKDVDLLEDHEDWDKVKAGEKI